MELTRGIIEEFNNDILKIIAKSGISTILNLLHDNDVDKISIVKDYEVKSVINDGYVDFIIIFEVADTIEVAVSEYKVIKQEEEEEEEEESDKKVYSASKKDKKVRRIIRRGAFDSRSHKTDVRSQLLSSKKGNAYRRKSLASRKAISKKRSSGRLYVKYKSKEVGVNEVVITKILDGLVTKVAEEFAKNISDIINR